MYELKDIKHKARQFISKTHINANDLCDIKRTIKSLGFKIIEYGRFANSEAVASLIKLLQVDNLCKQMYAFTYIDKNNRFVFVRSGLDEDDEKYVLLHEIGHIYLNHLSADSHVLSSTVRCEFEANEFAHFLYIYSHNPRKKYKPVTFKVCAVLAALIVVGATLFGFVNAGVIPVSVNNVRDYQPSDGNGLQNGDNLSEYYVTSGGKKYHKRNCVVIKYKTNIRRAGLKEIQDGVYKPCMVCFPE